MNLSWTTLLWIAGIVVLLLAIWWIWRNWTKRTEAPSMSEPQQPTSGAIERPSSASPGRRSPAPTTAPPPALAGPNPHAGRIDPSNSRATANGAGQAPAPRTPSARPPAAAAGPVPTASPSGPAPVTRQRSSVAPPPAAAGATAPSASQKAPAAPKAEAARPASKSGLVAARSWGYQLQNLDLGRAAASPFDVLVVDYSRDGSDEKALGAKDLEKMRQMPGGGHRQLLAYLSVGEAESYRYYWDPAWAKSKPAWLLSENPDWEENYAVCFWDPGWQRLMCGTPQSYLDKIIAAGFDGVYLDKCDVFEDLERREKKAAKSRPDLEADMVRFVVDLTRYAKSKSPGFAVVMQNAENLLEHEALRVSIDAVAKEELLFGLSGSQRKNAKAEVAEARKLLDLAKSAGKAVFVVEYLDDAAKIAEAAQYAEAAGYNLYIAAKDRELDRLNYESFEA